MTNIFSKGLKPPTSYTIHFVFVEANVQSLNPHPLYCSMQVLMKSTDEVQDGFLRYTDHRQSPVAVEGITSSGWDRGSCHINGFKR